ncbi:MAG: DUF2062 domain-containing protein [Opitutaceae bacterium]|nr:DUF2062 domain-containing protein [Opitutaceae bacterium]
MHKSRLSRRRLRGGFLHSRLGDRLVDKALWQPTHDSLARAWLVGFPITMMPFLPLQSVLACVAALLVRGNLLLCIALQFLSTPFTAPVHLPACYFVGEVARGQHPVEVWRHISGDPKELLTGHAVSSLYFGAVIIGLLGGLLGYAVLRHTWRPSVNTRPPLPRNRDSSPPMSKPPIPVRSAEKVA